MRNHLFGCSLLRRLIVMVALVSMCAAPLLAANRNTARTYYVSNKGNDSNNGLTPQKAWRTIGRVNRHSGFKPGDKILFHRSDVWNDTIALHPLGNGNAKSVITLGAWGEGKKPVISVSGKGKDAVLLVGQSYWVIEDLRVSSVDGNGVAVDCLPDVLSRSITISRIEAFDCSPTYGQRSNHCGIKIGHNNRLWGSLGNANLRDIYVKECVVDNCATGIMISGKRYGTPFTDESKISHNAVIEDCIARNIRGDGIVIFSFADAIIRYCLCYNASTYNKDNQCTAAIWTWNVLRGYVTKCESYGHITPGCDRNPFDSDYRSSDVVFEDNFGHDSYGAGILMCAPGGTNDNTEFRNNYFRNCGYGNTRQPGFIWFYDCDKKQNRYIHDNKFICSPNAMFGSTSGRMFWCHIDNNVFITSKDSLAYGSPRGWEPTGNKVEYSKAARLLEVEDNLSADFAPTSLREISFEEYKKLYEKSLASKTEWKYGPRVMSLEDKYIDHCNRVEVYRYYQKEMSDYSWKPSNTGGGGYIIGMLQSPQRDNVYYVRCDVAGMFRSEDGCKTWKTINGGLTRWYHHYVRSIAVHPDNDNVIFRCSGDKRNGQLFGSVHRSDDGGNIWKEVLSDVHFWGNGETRQYGEIIKFDTDNHNRILLADFSGQVFISKNTGETWEKVFDVNGCVTSVSAGSVYYLTTNEGKLFASYDKGINWKEISDLRQNIRDIVIQKTDKRDNLWLTTDKGILCSTDGGKHFKFRMKGLPRNCSYIGLAVDSSNPAIMYCAQDDRPHTEPAPIPIYKSMNGGNSWELINTHTLSDIKNPPSYYTSIEKAGWAISKVIVDWNNPEHLLFSNWYGVCESADGGKTYDAHGFQGLETSCIESVLYNKDSKDEVVFTLADHRPMISRDNGEHYIQLDNQKYPSTSSITFSNDGSSRIFYGGYSRSKSDEVRDAVDEGAIIRVDSLGSTIVWEGKTGFVQALKASNHVPGKYYAYVEGDTKTTAGIWRTLDNGDTWQRMTNPFDKKIDFLPYNYQFIDNELLNIVVGQVKNISGSNQLLEVDVNDPQTIYVGERSTGIYVSNNDGADWTPISAELPFLRDTASVLTVIRQDKVKGYLYAGFVREGLWRTADCGKSWEKVWPLDDSVCNISSLWVENDRIIIAGEDLYWAPMKPMVAISNNGGKSFKNVYDDKLGALRIKGIDVNPTDGRIFVVTSGNGAFHISQTIPQGTEKKILYVNSYHKGYAPSDEVEEAIRKVVAERGDDIETFYLDCKRNANPDYAASRALAVAERIKEMQPDGIIVSDDDAVKHVVLPYLRDTEMPVAFCGVNWDCKQYGLPCQNVTGILEVLPLKQLLHDFAPLVGSAKRIAILSENTLSERNNKALLDTLYRNEGYTPCYYLVNTFDEWKEVLCRLNDEADIVYMPTNGAISGWDNEAAERMVGERLRIPSITCDDFMMPYCVAGYTKVASEQGDTAVRMLYRMMDEDVVPQLTENKQVKIYYNKDLSKKIGYSIDKISKK